MEGESQGLLGQSTPLAQRASERLERFQANVEAAKQEIEDLYERYIGLGVPLTGEDFGKQVLAVVRGLGFVAERTKPTADGGIDIIARRADPLLRGKYIMQCKNWSKPVGEPVVREFYGVVTAERANKGILITTSRFSQPALEFAVGKPLELIDGDGWRELVLGMPVVPVKEITEGKEDPTAYLAVVKLIWEKLGSSLEGLTQAVSAIPGMKKEKGELKDGRYAGTEGQLDNYLSGLETWAQDSVSIMKELAVARPPADCRELYREILGGVHDVFMAVLREPLGIGIEDGRIVIRLEFDVWKLFEPVLKGANRLLALSAGKAGVKLDEFENLIEKEEGN